MKNIKYPYRVRAEADNIPLGLADVDPMSESTMRKHTTPLVYLAGIVLVNLGFAHLPIFDTPYGPLPMMAFFVGFIFVLRDYAQSAVGHGVIPYMAVGVLLVWWLADAQLALASSVSFLISEVIDWAIYTITKKPFSERVLLSSVFSVPADTVAFLGLIGFLSVGAFAMMTASKFMATLFVWYYLRRR